MAERGAGPSLRAAVGLLGITTLTFAVLGIVAERDGSVAAASAPTPASASATPVLSARRAPELLARPQAARRLRSAVDPLVAALPDASCLVVSDGGTRLVEHRADQPVVPASNLKVLTAAAALRVLGPETTLTTRFVAEGGLRDGQVEGDLWMVGGGDPVIDSETYQRTQRYGTSPHTSVEDLADRLVDAGLRRVTGSVRGDDDRYDDLRTVPSWPDRYITQNQVGPLSALAVNDAKTFPVLEGQSGTPRPAPDPPAAAAAALTQLLEARGVAVDGEPASGDAPDDATELLAVPSLPVRDLVAQMLTFSDNNTAELLTKELGHATTGSGTTEDGTAATLEALAEAGLPTDGVELVDGSGLDAGNRATCDLLDRTLAADGPDGPIARGLAVAGRTGTLRDRFRRSPAAEVTRAKTGTLRGVSALSGWVATPKGTDLRFALVLNSAGGAELGASQTGLEQKVVEALLGYPDAADPAVLAPRRRTP